MESGRSPIIKLSQTNVALTARLARAAITLDETIAAITSHELDQAAVDLITPMRSHLQLATDRLDEAFLEVEQHGKSYPQGKPRLDITGPNCDRRHKASDVTHIHHQRSRTNRLPARSKAGCRSTKESA